MANIYRNLGAVIKDTGGLWELSIARWPGKPAPLPEGMGLWGMIVTVAPAACGMRSTARPSCCARTSSGRHALTCGARQRTRRDPAPRRTAASVGSRPAAHQRRRRCRPQWHADALRPDAADIWHKSAEETGHGPARRSVFAQQVRPATCPPFVRRIQGYAQRTDARGETYWIAEPAHRRLPAPDRRAGFPGEQMDGQASVQDIAVAYAGAAGHR